MCQQRSSDHPAGTVVSDDAGRVFDALMIGWLLNPKQLGAIHAPAAGNSPVTDLIGERKRVMKMKTILAGMISLFLPAAGPAQPAKAPDVPLKLLQADRESLTRWSELKGKAVVLEFWATWCGPCIEKFPRLTELAGKFADKPVQFIFVTDESLETTSAFLKLRPIATGWVAYAAKEAIAAFKVTGRPMTVLIDRSGYASGEVFTTELDERILEDLIAGKPVGRKTMSRAGSEQAMASAWLARSSETVVQMRLGDNLQGRGVDIGTLLEFVYDVRPTRMEFAQGVDRRTRYDFEVKVDQHHSKQSSLLWRSLVEASLPMRIKPVTKERAVWVLSKADDGALGLRPLKDKFAGTFSFSMEKGTFLAENTNLWRLGWYLENSLEEPVVDETGLSGLWRMEMNWKPGDKTDLMRTLEEQMGLRLERAQRSVEVLQIDPL